MAFAQLPWGEDICNGVPRMGARERIERLHGRGDGDNLQHGQQPVEGNLLLYQVVAVLIHPLIVGLCHSHQDLDGTRILDNLSQLKTEKYPAG